jgi:glutaredoxin
MKILYVEDNDTDLQYIQSEQVQLPVPCIIVDDTVQPHQFRNHPRSADWQQRIMSLQGQLHVYILRLNLLNKFIPIHDAPIEHILDKVIILYMNTFYFLEDNQSPSRIIPIYIPKTTGEIPMAVSVFRKQVQSANRPSLLVFSRPTCPWCIKLKPYINQVSSSHPVFLFDTSSGGDPIARDTFINSIIPKDKVAYVPAVFKIKSVVELGGDLTQFSFTDSPDTVNLINTFLSI